MRRTQRVSRGQDSEGYNAYLELVPEADMARELGKWRVGLTVLPAGKERKRRPGGEEQRG